MSDDKSPKQESQGTTALATRQDDVKLASSAEYQQYVATLKSTKRYHLLSPIVDVGALPQQWALVPRKVKINPDPAGLEVYRDSLFCKPDEVALTKVGLRKLAAAAGLSTRTTSMDSGHVRFFWRWQCEIGFRNLNGERETRTASYEWDLTDGSPRIAGMSSKELNRARLNGMRRCEAGAINAAIREIGIPQKFKQADLEIEFVVFNLMFQPDMSDPAQAAIVTQMALSNTDAMYPRALPPAPMPQDHAHDADEHLDGEVVKTVAKSGPAQRGGYTILKVYKEPRQGQDPIYFITTQQTGDEQLYTDDLFVAQAAKAHAVSGEPCDMSLVTRNGARWIDELVSGAGEIVEPGDGAAEAQAQVFVTDIKSVSGVNKTSNKPWTRRTITLSTGEVATTFFDKLAAVAERAWKEKLPVTAILEDNEQYPDQKNLKELTIIDTRQPTLPTTEEL